MPKLNALIAGSTGYIGIQLVKLLIKHPNINIKYLCGNTSKGKSISYFDKSIKNKKLPKIIKFNNNLLNNINDSIVVITDIRYDDYPKDEVFWLKKELGGVLVHISMYEELIRLNGRKKEFVQPINSEEERNDPKLKSQADYIVEWEKAKNDKEKELEPYIDAFISWLNGEENRLSAYQKAENSRV